MFGIEACVICRRGNAPSKFRSQGVCLLSSWRVDDAWPMGAIEQQFTGEFSTLRRRNLDDLNRDIRAPESMNEPLRLTESQLFPDIVLNQGGRRCGKRNNGCRAQ